MNVEFTTTELITDEEILSAFGESIRFDEGKFKIDSFIDCLEDRAEEEGYDPDEMEEGDWDELWSRVDENAYYSSSIEECEDDEEWNEYSGEIYGEDQILQ